MYEKGSVKAGNHIMYVFPDEESEFQVALDFLKEGLDKNELILFITRHFSNAAILETMENKWNLDAKKFFEDLDIILKDPSEFYIPDGRSFNPIKTTDVLEQATRYAIEKGKTGGRAFSCIHNIFENDVNDVISYERHLEKEFEIPFTAVCSYQKNNMERLSEEQFDIIKEHHLFIKEF